MVEIVDFRRRNQGSAGRPPRHETLIRPGRVAHYDSERAAEPLTQTVLLTSRILSEEGGGCEGGAGGHGKAVRLITARHWRCGTQGWVGRCIEIELC